MEKLILGGGCFWCTEAVYENVIGVFSVESAYSGGSVDNPSYQDICTGTTGHAEVIQITYDPTQVDREELLEIFWVIHDPTTLNQQGADKGTQYRSVIFYENDEQKATALASIEKVQVNFSDKIVTEVSPLMNYYPAEGYHQHYFANNPNQGYCQAVVAPKVEKFKTHFSDMKK